MIDWEFIIIELGIVVGAYLFLGIMYIISALIVGWNQLAIVYPPEESQNVRTFRMRRVVVGRGGFPLGLDVKLTTSGLYLLIPWLFRFAFRSIYVPWSELRPTGRYMFSMKRIEFIVFSVPFSKETRLMIPSDVFQSGEDLLPNGFIESFKELQWIAK